ncbi:DOHH hydroxylase, partial [Quiscalus mexicanus]|nr:DOHH hydroxylase [Quiscalus mexicanus]
RTLVDAAQPLPARFRALFTLRNLGGRAAVEWISRGFGDGSALLKHELAYCLGQLQDEAAIPVLIRVLEDTAQEPMVRHEAGEALGAIGNPDVLDVLKRYSQDPVVEVAETCQLAVRRLEWLQNNKEQPGRSPYLSVDPAPPAEETDVAKLREILLDESQELFERYRAMFALRNVGGQAAVLALAEALLGGRCCHQRRHWDSAGIREQGWDQGAGLGLGSRTGIREQDWDQGAGLGSGSRPCCLRALRAFAGDEERVVRESCQVALDMYEYENGAQFQYADGLCKLQA